MVVGHGPVAEAPLTLSHLHKYTGPAALLHLIIPRATPPQSHAGPRRGFRPGSVVRPAGWRCQRIPLSHEPLIPSAVQGYHVAHTCPRHPRAPPASQHLIDDHPVRLSVVRCITRILGHTRALRAVVTALGRGERPGNPPPDVAVQRWDGRSSVLTDRRQAARGGRAAGAVCRHTKPADFFFAGFVIDTMDMLFWVSQRNLPWRSCSPSACILRSCPVPRFRRPTLSSVCLPWPLKPSPVLLDLFCDCRVQEKQACHRMAHPPSKSNIGNSSLLNSR
ncbi:hypothetical protein DFH06DRAFT_144447 [Mycena polygramma]|nr:hypothetical protein DFH06DRAFT_144447 [Mycena polygramma]